MIRGLVRLAAGGVAIAWAVERLLEGRAGGAPPPPITSLIVIDAPVEAVWETLSDIEGQPRWMRDMKSVRMTTPAPVGVGSRGVATVRVFGVAVTDPVSVTEYEPPRTFAIRHEGLVSGGGLFRLEPGADGSTTIVRWEETLVAPLVPRLASVIFERVFGRIFQEDLERLRHLVESPAA